MNTVIISECLKDDATAVYLFIRKLIAKLKLKFIYTSKLIYVTDGVTLLEQIQLFKPILIMHNIDFACDAEWHFHATSYGKGPCDGIGGAVKRKTTQVSLTREYNNQISTPQHIHLQLQ